ncbi:MAG: HIT domain-containing protein [Candidatus Paceibacterota bacterium]|jgi:diadenosine tetraphosphate (Ap4A) HIT family hydrolase
MKIEKPLPRNKYKTHLKDLNGGCAFCKKPSDLVIKEYKNWVWVFSAFPYKKYHTLLFSKRHIIKFSELDVKELGELKKILGEIEYYYREKKIICKNSKFGDQIFFSWRSRYNDKIKKSVSHFHLHIYPQFAQRINEIIDKDSWDINTSIFKNI